MKPEQQALVDLILAIDPDQMTETQRLRLTSMMAAYAGVQFSEVRVVSVTPANSSRVRMQFPPAGARMLLEGFSRRDARLSAFLEDFVLLRAEGVRPTVGEVGPREEAERNPVDLGGSRHAPTSGSRIITLADLALAFSNRIGLDEEDAMRDANFVMDIFGFDDRVIDNVLEPEDRQLFYILEEAGIFTIEREETNLYDGREWRTHYWLFKRNQTFLVPEEDRRARYPGKPSSGKVDAHKEVAAKPAKRL